MCSQRLVSNNRADAEYLALGTGIDAPTLPSLCAYTAASYTGRKPQWVMMGYGGEVPAAARGVLVGAREALRPRYDWAELYDYKGVVVLPYEVAGSQTSTPTRTRTPIPTPIGPGP